MNIVPLKNGKFKFEQKYKCPNTNKWRKVSITLNSKSAQAKNKATKILIKKIAEKTTPKNQKKYKIEEVIKKFLEEKRRSVRASTLNTSISCGRELVRYLPKDYFINDLNANMVQKFINYKFDRYSYSCAKLYFTFIRQLLKFAKRWEYIKDNSYINKIVLKKPPTTINDLEKQNSKLLDKEELKTVLKKIKEVCPICGLILEFQSLTGLRINELLALRIKDFKHNYISITASYEKGGVRNPPKNAYSIRNVYLNKRAIEIINYFINRALNYYAIHEPKTEKFIFITSNGLPYDYHFINRKLKQINHPKHITTHAFRHTHISLLMEKKVPLKAIMQRVGHHEMRTTMNIYTHVTEKMNNAMKKALEEL